MTRNELLAAAAAYDLCENFARIESTLDILFDLVGERKALKLLDELYSELQNHIKDANSPKNSLDK